MDSLNEKKKLQSYIMLALVISLVSLISSIVKNMVIERWAKSRDIIACVPAEISSSFPLVYAQTSAHPLQSDALMKTFIEEYVRSTQDEQIVNYHALSNAGRYNNIRLSESRLKSIEMSLEGTPERALNMKRYADSNDVLQNLKRCNCGWVFLIDDIIVIPNVNSGQTFVSVRGEFQVTYDKAKAELPDQLWGYREFNYIIQQGVPTMDSKDQNLNKHGMFVSWSYTRILNLAEREKLSQRNHDYYMQENK